MRFDLYADAIGGISVIQRGTGIPMSTLSRLYHDPHSGQIRTISAIVAFSRQNPAPSGETVRFEDFTPPREESAA